VALDSGFAMAWRKLAAALTNSLSGQEEGIAAATKAYENRDRLPEIERYQTTAYYFWLVDYDPEKAISAYQAILDINPDEPIASNNLALVWSEQREWARAESLTTRSVAAGAGGNTFNTLADAQMSQGKDAAVRATMAEFLRGDSTNALPRVVHALYMGSRHWYDSAETDLRWLEQHAREPEDRAFVPGFRAEARLIAGQLREGEKQQRAFMAEGERRGLPRDYLIGVTSLADVQSLYRADPAGGARVLDAALARYPAASMSALDRPYVLLATSYAIAGQPARARQLMKEYAARVPPGLQRHNAYRHMATGYIALAEGRSQDAIAAFRTWWDEADCTNCALPDLGRAYDQAGQPDSALAVYQRAADNPGGIITIYQDAFNLEHTYRRLGELYEEKGDRDKALDYYGRFTALWKDADPELQPQVREVKQRMAKLAGEKATP
ncbi:MAG TPA: tetratricopeptide repeat protein, partial [Gemmatimonadales bacterium]|nr:tetratricopeptide repeat protein [Gemmatimonadales bacterium]